MSVMSERMENVDPARSVKNSVVVPGLKMALIIGKMQNQAVHIIIGTYMMQIYHCDESKPSRYDMLSTIQPNHLCPYWCTTGRNQNQR